VFRVSPGDNGTFDGVPPTGDDAASHFDVGLFGAEDCEGLGYDADRDTLLVVDRNTNTTSRCRRRFFVSATFGGRRG
jgi:hypothetical protein